MTAPFQRVLIANRGEIALRIARACRELGIEVVAAYSTADRDSPVVRLADRSVHIGPPAPKASYLNIPSLIEAALQTEVDPGGTAAFLVWGDPALYDSTLRVLDQVADRGAVVLDVSVVPGITAPQALAAAFAIPLHGVGEPVLVTTGRRLAEGWPDDVRELVVMLDGRQAFAEIDPTGIHIWWGAYLGAADQIPEHLALPLVLQIQLDGALSGVLGEKGRSDAGPVQLGLRSEMAGEVARAGHLDLDHLRAEEAELVAAVRAGEDVGEIENPDAPQRWVCHGPTPGRGGRIPARSCDRPPR